MWLEGSPIVGYKVDVMVQEPKQERMSVRAGNTGYAAEVVVEQLVVAADENRDLSGMHVVRDPNVSGGMYVVRGPPPV